MTYVKTWHDKLYEEIVEDKELSEETAIKFFDAYWRFPALEFINFHVDQLPNKESLALDDASTYWNDVSLSSNELFEAVSRKDHDKTVISAYLLGLAIGRLQNHIDGDVLKNCFQAAKEKDDREQPLRDKEIAYSAMKEITQVIAKREWEKDTSKEIRLGEMVQIVWPQLVDVVNGHKGEKYLSTRGAEGIRKWVKEVAPDYAKRGGRPSTK